MYQGKKAAMATFLYGCFHIKDWVTANHDNLHLLHPNFKIFLDNPIAKGVVYFSTINKDRLNRDHMGTCSADFMSNSLSFVLKNSSVNVFFFNNAKYGRNVATQVRKEFLQTIAFMKTNLPLIQSPDSTSKRAGFFEVYEHEVIVDEYPNPDVLYLQDLQESAYGAAKKFQGNTQLATKK